MMPLRVLVGALAALGVGAAAALALGRLHWVESESAGSQAHIVLNPPGQPAQPAQPATDAPHAAAVATAGAANALQARRYAVCGREEAPPRLFELAGPPNVQVKDEPRLWAVSCGSSVHVVAFDTERTTERDGRAWIFARRVARLTLPSPAPDRAPRPAPIVRLDSGAAASWLVGTLRSDRNGSPVSGALFRVALWPGAFGAAPALRVHDAAPSALVTATLDRNPGDDFALLQLGDARAAQASELWMFSGGPAPTRTARVPVQLGETPLATLGASLLAVADLNGDGLDEAAVLSPATSRVLFPGAVPATAAATDAPGAPAATVAVDVPGALALHALDLNRDGHRVLIAAGEHAYLVRRPSPESAVSAPLPALDGLRELAALDIDADGKPEAIGYAHPELVAVADPLGAHPMRKSIVALRGAGLSVLAAQLAQLGDDGAPDVLVLATSDGPDPQVELVVASIDPAQAAMAEALRLDFPAKAAPLRDIPLRRELELR